MQFVRQKIELSEIPELKEVFTKEKIILLSVIICGINIFVFLIRRLLEHPFMKTCLLPGPNASPLLFYLTHLKSIYKQSSEKIPAWCILFQGVSGYCKCLPIYRIFRVYVGFKPIVLFYKPETVEVILSSTTLIEKAKEYSLLHQWLGNGLLTSTGEKWRKRRKLLTPTFHFAILEDFIPIFNEHSNILVWKLQTLSKKNWVDVVPLMTTVALDSVCHTAMGIRINTQMGEHAEYANAINQLSDAFLYRLIRPWLYPDFIFKLTPTGRKHEVHLRRLLDFTRQVIKEKKEIMIESRDLNSKEADERYSQVKKRRAFLELLLEEHFKDSSLTEEDIREEVDTFMLEGHDTTSMALSWSLYFIGLDEDVQKTVHNELDEIFQNDNEREITKEDLVQMKYLECVIKETLRFHPSVPILAREATESFKVLDYTIHKGSACAILPSILHQDEESFPEPERFIPERFFPEACIGRHNYAYVPFSAGPRNCIGQKYAYLEMKTVLAHVLRRYHVTSLDPRDKVNVIPLFVTRNVEPLRLRFTARQQIDKYNSQG